MENKHKTCSVTLVLTMTLCTEQLNSDVNVRKIQLKLAKEVLSTFF